MPTVDDAIDMRFEGPAGAFLLDEAHQVCLEGAIRSGKTTVACWKVLRSCLEHPGIHWLMCRYSDGDTRSILRPIFEKVCVDAGVPVQWDAQQRCYKFPNESWVYAFGIKAQSLAERYAKFRGLTLAAIYNDQTEELPPDIYQELIGRLSQKGYPHQIILTPNPMEEDSWLADEFPIANTIPRHKYYAISIYDNARNLDAEYVRELEQTYPPGHVKHRPLLLGQRGINVIGSAVYGAVNPHEPETAAFQRARHERPLALNPDLPLYESIDYGKRHPCVIWGQYTPWSDLYILGGVMGHDLFLEDFAPIVQQYRQRWFPNALEVVTCCDPAGSHNNSQGVKQNGVSVLRDKGFVPTWKDDSNSPGVRAAMIERLAGHMRRRTPNGEAFGIDDSRWMRISLKSAVKAKFLADGCEAGYVWDKNMVSVGNKQVRKPKKDGWYEHGQNCLEYLEHNFGGVQPTLEQAARRAASVRRQTQAPDIDPYDIQIRRAQRRAGLGRGGYS